MADVACRFEKHIAGNESAGVWRTRWAFASDFIEGICQGKPDLAFPKYRAVVFVHGCFWHRHPRCPKASTPKSRTEFWNAKFASNVKRDQRNVAALRAQGWRVFAIWECEAKSDEEIHAVLSQIPQP